MAVAEQSVADQHLPQPDGVSGDDRIVQLGTSRGDLGGMLQWEGGDAEPKPDELYLLAKESVRQNVE